MEAEASPVLAAVEVAVSTTIIENIYYLFIHFNLILQVSKPIPNIWDNILDLNHFYYSVHNMYKKYQALHWNKYKKRDKYFVLQ